MLPTLVISMLVMFAPPGGGDRDTIPRAEAPNPSRRPMSMQSTQASRLIWDYRDTSPSKVSLPDYHAWLFDYCKAEQPARLVLYVTSPLNPGTGYCEFYDPGATPATGAGLNLVGFLQEMATDASTSGIEVVMLMDASSFRPNQAASCGTWTPQPVDPTINGVAPPPLPTGWPAFATGLDWFQTLAENSALSAGGLHGLAIDPESRQNSGSVEDDYAALAIWMDMFQSSGPATVQSKSFGMTVGVASHTFAKLLTTDLPVPADYPTAPVATFLDSSRNLTYRTTTTPLLEDVYMQVYTGCEVVGGVEQPGSFYRWICEGGCDGSTTQPRSIVSPWASVAETSANLLVATLQRRPELPGPGTISTIANPNVPNPYGGNPGGSILNGTGTRFDLWPEAARVQLLDGASRIPAAPWAVLNPPSNPILAQGNGAQVDQSTPLPYVYTEISIDYAVPSTTADQVDRFWFMFSAEKASSLPFFGYWAYADFESFLQELEPLVQQAATAPFADASGTPIARPLGLGLYSLYQASRNWGGDFYADQYPGSTTPLADIDNDGVVGPLDLMEILSRWGDVHVPADLNRDGGVNHMDLHLLLDAWDVAD